MYDIVQIAEEIDGRLDDALQWLASVTTDAAYNARPRNKTVSRLVNYGLREEVENQNCQTDGCWGRTCWLQALG